MLIGMIIVAPDYNSNLNGGDSRYEVIIRKFDNNNRSAYNFNSTDLTLPSLRPSNKKETNERKEVKRGWQAQTPG